MHPSGPKEAAGKIVQTAWWGVFVWTRPAFPLAWLVPRQALLAPKALGSVYQCDQGTMRYVIDPDSRPGNAHLGPGLGLGARWGPTNRRLGLDGGEWGGLTGDLNLLSSHKKLADPSPDRA